MRLRRQTLEEILEKLSPVETDWMDEHAERVIAVLEAFPKKDRYELADVAEHLLDRDFEAGTTAVRLFLALSKDEFVVALREVGASAWGIKAYRDDPSRLLGYLNALGLRKAITVIVGRPTTWSDVLIERLRSGRGSAIKGQRRGRTLEDFTERFVAAVFGAGNYDVRCRFVGESGVSTEKCEFAIPNKKDPRILIEAKAYGATGGKQTDVLGDAERIINQKRHDTTFLLVTDGLTWTDRKNDMRKLLELQNRGRIARIYTVKMANEFRRDLRQLKTEQGL